MDDTELLRLYLAERSQSAFAELVRRHLGLVYHTALRVCGGDAHRAEDVAQTVFVDLARKARELSSRSGLAGWLYTSARYAAAQAVRTEVRRQAREADAGVMNEADPTPDWEKVRAVIDEALDGLGEVDREAVLLRYFADRPFAEIGRQLSVSEDAARMRVDRALDKMRDVLNRRGVASTAAALSTVLLSQASAAVPAGLAASVTTAALGSGVVTSVVAFMSITKLQAALVTAIAVAGITGLVVQHNRNGQLQADVATLTAETRRLAEGVKQLEQPKAATESKPEEISVVAGPTPAPPAPAAAASKPVPSPHPLAAGLLPVENLGNSGVATPRAAWFTQLWAARAGDLALESSTLAFSPQDRAKLEALATTLPADLRTQYDSAEKLMALALAANPHPVGGMQVVSEKAQGPDDMVLQTEWQRVDDDVVHHSEVLLHHDTGGWKVVMPTSIVDRAVAYLSRDASGAPHR